MLPIRIIKRVDKIRNKISNYKKKKCYENW